MPYGYEQYRLSKGISPKTTYVEVRLIQELLAFVDFKYKKKLEAREIKPIDIREFIIKQKEERNLKDSTISRKLTAIRNWYDYLWRAGKIEHDFMTKFTLSKKMDTKKEKININYECLLSKKKEILQSTKVLLYAKMLYLLYMKGFRVRDIVKITLDQIEEQDGKIIIEILKSNGCTQRAEFFKDEVRIICECMERADIRGTPYLLSSYVDREYIPLQLGSLKDFMASIRDVLGVPFRSEQIRLAYVHYLYTNQHKSIEELQVALGLPLASLTQTLREALERIESSVPKTT